VWSLCGGVVCNGSSISGPQCFVKFWRERDMCGLCVGVWSVMAAAFQGLSVLSNFDVNVTCVVFVSHVWSVMAAAFQGLSVLSSSDVNVTCEVFVWGCDAKRNER